LSLKRGPCFQNGSSLNGGWIDHLRTMIEMNDSKLAALAQIRVILARDDMQQFP
jgi:hypothetical protein